MLEEYIYHPKIDTIQWRIQDFLEEGAPTPGGMPTYDFAKNFQKLHKIERIWTPRGSRVPRGPLRSPTAIDKRIQLEKINNLINERA